MSQTEVATVENDSIHETNSYADAGDTNITRTGTEQTNSQNENNDNVTPGKDNFCFSDINPANLEYLRKLNAEFIKARNWDQFHSPRNVLLALVGEVGELAEIFQWKGEVSEGLPELSEAEREHVGQEVSDILIYLIDFASRCRIDLPKAVASKMAANAVKYPEDKAYGKANKYTDYT
ncbi:hypothetical protein BsWGS_07434 [Bradybaena similaris]